MAKDIVLLKKYYGEKFSRLCRDLFPSILEEEGKLFNIIDNHFAHSHNLYDDLITNDCLDDFKTYIYSFIFNNNKSVTTNLLPQQLMSMAGYNLYECKTESDIQKFKKYYIPGEELCTFRGRRLETCHVFFAVKKDVAEIKREDFIKPERQDKYGTSVISIQFSKNNNNYLSIKNRYNHTVPNPDATFGNNLDNIIPGLNDAFKNQYGFNICNKEEELYIPGYVMASDGKLYKYNYELYNTYYCPNNVIIDAGKLIDDFKDKSRYIFIDYFIIDMHKKRIFCYDESLDEPFRIYYDNFNRIDIEKKGNYRLLNIYYFQDKVLKIGVDNLGRIISFEDNNIMQFDNYFLHSSKYIKDFKAKNVTMIYDQVLMNAEDLESIELPNVCFIGNEFLLNNTSLSSISLPNVKEIYSNFMYNNRILRKFYAPNLLVIHNSFLMHNISLLDLNLESVEEIGYNFIPNNDVIRSINLPNVQSIGNNFCTSVDNIKNLVLDNVITIGDSFMFNNRSIETISMASVKKVGNDFMNCNEKMVYAYLPNVEIIGDNFLATNYSIKQLVLPKVEKIGSNFFDLNCEIEYFEAPNLKCVGTFFFHNNQMLENLELPSIEKIGNYFLMINNSLKRFIAPQLNFGGLYAFYSNESLEEIEVGSKCFIYRDTFFQNKKKKQIIRKLMQNGKWCKEKVKKIWMRLK